MTEASQQYVIDAHAQAQLTQLSRMVTQLQYQMSRGVQSNSAPPVAFGKVTTTWVEGEDTLEIDPVATDDLAVLDSSGDSKIDIYIAYGVTPTGLDIAADDIVPYFPFGGVDQDDVWGILAPNAVMTGIAAYAGQFAVAKTGALTVSIAAGYVIAGTLSKSISATASLAIASTAGTHYVYAEADGAASWATTMAESTTYPVQGDQVQKKLLATLTVADSIITVVKQSHTGEIDITRIV